MCQTSFTKASLMKDDANDGLPNGTYQLEGINREFEVLVCNFPGQVGRNHLIQDVM
jgi:hypothetical protein